MININKNILPFDTDAQRFIFAGGVTNWTEKRAVNYLIPSLKSTIIWKVCNAIYPIINNSKYACSLNLKNPRDLDAAYRLVFFNSPIFSSKGISWNGSTQYASTKLNAQTVLSTSSNHFSYYTRSTSALGSPPVYDMGARATAANDSVFMTIENAGSGTGLFDTGYAVFSTPTSQLGLWIWVRNSATLSDLKIYQNGISTGASGFSFGSTNLPNLEVFLGAYNSDGSPTAYTDRPCLFSTIGQSIDSSIAYLMYQSVQLYQIILWQRQV